MKIHGWALAVGMLALFHTTAVAQRGDHQEGARFNDHDQQVTREWYKQHEKHPPAGFRQQDRLSRDQEARFHEGAVLDKDMRRRIHSAPPDLTRQLPPPPSHNRYVAIGGHVGLIDDSFHVNAIIHLHE